MSHPTSTLITRPETPRIGTLDYGLVGQHKELVDG